MVLLLPGLLAGLAVGQNAYALIGGCRGDPIVFLSNGYRVQMTASIATDAANIQHVTYTLHAPTGTVVTQVVQTSGGLSAKESLVFYADNPPMDYNTDTLVTSSDNSITVTATTAVTAMGRGGSSQGEADGQTNQHLLVSLVR
ncbi:MAG TPA: hypothetical protein VKY74_15305 [Chloroflexia bacterium]|nr:hypothetical protein [Chloroflexia bacterium]